MDYTLFFAILNLIMFARLRLTFRDGGAGPADQVIMAVIPLLILPFLHTSTAWFTLLAYLLIVPAISVWAERGMENLNRNRGLLLILHIIATAWYASGLTELRSGLFIRDLELILHDFILPDSSGGHINWIGFHVFVFGLLLIMNEMNIVIRYLMELMNLKQITLTSNGVDEQDYNTGRVIGLLERIFIYILILAGQITAVGFILTAKGIIRYPELKNKTFAEYVLIGTLLSSLSALIIAYFVLFF